MNCIVCDTPDAPFQAPSFLTFTERLLVRAYYRSFRDDNGNPIYHTGHLRTDLMELPARVCKDHRGPILPRRAPDHALVCTACGAEWAPNETPLHTESECKAVTCP